MLRIGAPLISLVCLIVGMTHQIKIIIEKGSSDELSIPRILLGIFSGIVWVFYGLQIRNEWMMALNIAGIIMNVALIYVIKHLDRVKKNKEPL